MAKGKHKVSQQEAKEGISDWIASLAKQSASGSASAGTSATNSSTAIPSKSERIQKRAAKKARRQQRQEERKRPITVEDRPTAVKTGPQKRASDHDSTKRRMKQLAKLLMDSRKEHQNDQRQRLYTSGNESHRRKRKRPLNETNIQPRRSDYSGIGLARKSLFLSFQDPSHIPKLEEEFHEHIPGFFGRQRTKAMKRQLDGNMLWRKLADQKEKGGGVLPKKFAQLPPDERVQAMIDAGIV